MSKHEFAFKKVLHKRGAYMKIEMEVDFYPSTMESKLEISYNADHEWKSSCEAGIHIFHDYFRYLNKGRLKITVNRINWLPVDTNNLIVLYATIMALCEILNFNVEDLQLDIQNEVFVFPEARKILLSLRDN